MYTVHGVDSQKCSGVKGRQQYVVDFQCTKCVGCVTINQGGDIKEVEIGMNEKLECIAKFCYMGDMICAEDGVQEASRAMVRCAWAKFRELTPILTSRGASLAVKGKVYKACVQRVMMYGSETWAMKNDQELPPEAGES